MGNRQTPKITYSDYSDYSDLPQNRSGRSYSDRQNKIFRGAKKKFYPAYQLRSEESSSDYGFFDHFGVIFIQKHNTMNYNATVLAQLALEISKLPGGAQEFEQNMELAFDILQKYERKLKPIPNHHDGDEQNAS